MSSVKKHVQRVRSVEPVNWVLLFLSLLMLGGSTVATWVSLRPETHKASVVREVTDEVTAVQARKLDSPEIPTLMLNSKNERLGPEVTVNPGVIGKENPFIK